MQRLSDAHKEQILSMNKDGKKADEIRAYLKTTYGIAVTRSGVYYTIRVAGAKSARPAAKPGKAKKAVAEDRGGDVNIVEEVVKLIRQINEGYKSVFKFLRAELIKSRGEVHAIMRGAGIPVEGEDGGDEVA